MHIVEKNVPISAQLLCWLLLFVSSEDFSFNAMAEKADQSFYESYNGRIVSYRSDASKAKKD